MNAQELRIGNLVNYYGVTEKVDPSLISAVNEDVFEVYGITLTGNWMLRLGGAEIKAHLPSRDKNAFLWGQDWQRLIFSGGYIHKPLPGDGFIRLNQEPIEFVHTFQNAMFALTGQELELKK